MAGQYDDWQLTRLIDENPREFIGAVCSISTDENGEFDQTEFTKLAVALAEVEGINLFTALNEAVDALELETGEEPYFAEFLERIIDRGYLYVAP